LPLFSYTPMSRKYSLNIAHQNAIYCKHKDIFAPHQGFKDKDCHKRNYSTFYYAHVNLGWILYLFTCLFIVCRILSQQLQGNLDPFMWHSIFYWDPYLKDWFCNGHRQLHQDSPLVSHKTHSSWWENLLIYFCLVISISHLHKRMILVSHLDAVEPLLW